MNWTEGSLVRHSRGPRRNALIVRQKQHFAKARRNLLNGHTEPGPITISFPAPKSTPELSRDHYVEPFSPLLPIEQGLGREHPITKHETDWETLTTTLARRKKLLEKSDWAGLELQKPLDISFPGQVYTTKRWAGVAHALKEPTDEPGNYATALGGDRCKRLRRASMRIKIGSQEIRPSVATSSQPSTKRHTVRNDPTTEERNCVHSSECERNGHGGVTSDEISQVPPTSLGLPETPINVVYSSSVIREPAPRRNGSFQVLQWSPPSSDDRGSMQVEIGRPVRAIPASQESEQQRWKDWVLYEENAALPSNSQLTVGNASEKHTFDSGSSALTLPSHLQPRLPSLHFSSEPDFAPRRSSFGRIDTENATEQRSACRENRCSQESSKLPPSYRRCAPQIIVDTSNSLNNMWMKFACEDDEESGKLLVDVFKQAARQAAMELQPSDASSGVDENVGTVATCGTELSSLDRRYVLDGISSTPSIISHTTTRGATCSETTSSKIATVGCSDQSLYNPARFTIPKAFVGKYVHAGRATTIQAANENILMSSKKKRGRKKATDGRTDIRALPDFDGDPIEEIEDD